MSTLLPSVPPFSHPDSGRDGYQRSGLPSRGTLRGGEEGGGAAVYLRSRAGDHLPLSQLEEHRTVWGQARALF